MIIQDFIKLVSPDTNIDLWTDSVVDGSVDFITLYKGPISNLPPQYLAGAFDLWRASNEDNVNLIHIWYLGETPTSQLTLCQLLRAYWYGLEWESGFPNQSLNITLVHSNTSILLASYSNYLHPPFPYSTYAIEKIFFSHGSQPTLNISIYRKKAAYLSCPKDK